MKVITTFLISASLTLAPVSAIVNGYTVPQGLKTYTTGIRPTIDPHSFKDYNYCGAVLIEPMHVLTTATCTTLGTPNYVSIGGHYYTGNHDGEEISVSSVIKNPNFNSKTLANNFAILKLSKASKHKPVKLPNADGSDIRSGMWGTAFGWGNISTSSVESASAVLLCLSQQVISNDACRKALKMTSIDMSQVCAGGEEGMSPCKGDIGGPFISENKEGDGDDVLIGIISNTKACGVKGSPTIYARVSSALPWIKSVIKQT